MPYKSRWSMDIPILSLPSYTFGAQNDKIGGKPILIDAEKPDNHLTQHTYREWSKRLAAGLKKHGFKPGERLLLYSGNSVFFPVVLQGTVMAGGIFSGANPGYVARELAYQLKDSGATYLVTAEASLDVALDAIGQIKFPRDHLFVMGDGSEVFRKTAKPVRGIQHWTFLLASEAEGSKFTWEEFTTRSQMDTTAVINYSSGTTGLPKGVEITHLNYIANCSQVEYMAQLDPEYDEKLARAKTLSFLPMYHAYGQTYHCISSPRKGVPVFIMRKFDFIKLLEYVQKYKITSLPLVPPVAVAIAKRPEVKKYDISTIEGAGCGAAPLSAESVNDFENVFDGRFQLKQGWGMTEITCSACGWDPTVDADPSKVGELNPNLEAMVVDDEGNELGVGERGEFWIRGPNVMKRYWNKPDETANTKTKDGWLKTGDIAIRHSDGYWSIVDRKKELIKVKGNQVAPAELEGLLLEHPSISDAAVIGVTISGEEQPRAYVVLHGEKKPSGKDIANWLAERVARHKRVTGGVVILDEIPKNPSGKILRKNLRERAAKEVGDKDERPSKM